MTYVVEIYGWRDGGQRRGIGFEKLQYDLVVGLDYIEFFLTAGKIVLKLERFCARSKTGRVVSCCVSLFRWN
jgi:hypothetical protein